MASMSKWFFTKEQLVNTPSRNYGTSAEEEMQRRQEMARFIQDLGYFLRVSQLCTNTAIVYMHRFYMFHPLRIFYEFNIAIAAVFLASKVENEGLKAQNLIMAVCKMLYNKDSSLDSISNCHCIQIREELIVYEMLLLSTIGQDLMIIHPHKYVIDATQLIEANVDLFRTSYILATNSLLSTTMCLQYQPELVACMCINIAIEWIDYEIKFHVEDKPWYKYIDPSATPEILEKIKQEFMDTYKNSPTKVKRIIQLESEKFYENLIFRRNDELKPNISIAQNTFSESKENIINDETEKKNFDECYYKKLKSQDESELNNNNNETSDENLSKLSSTDIKMKFTQEKRPEIQQNLLQLKSFYNLTPPATPEQNRKYSIYSPQNSKLENNRTLLQKVNPLKRKTLNTLYYPEKRSCCSSSGGISPNSPSSGFLEVREKLMTQEISSILKSVSPEVSNYILTPNPSLQTSLYPSKKYLERNKRRRLLEKKSVVSSLLEEKNSLGKNCRDSLTSFEKFEDSERRSKSKRERGRIDEREELEDENIEMMENLVRPQLRLIIRREDVNFRCEFRV